jgi:hypothetical protein
MREVRRRGTSCTDAQHSSGAAPAPPRDAPAVPGGAMPEVGRRQTSRIDALAVPRAALGSSTAAMREVGRRRTSCIGAQAARRAALRAPRDALAIPADSLDVPRDAVSEVRRRGTSRTGSLRTSGEALDLRGEAIRRRSDANETGSAPRAHDRGSRRLRNDAIPSIHAPSTVLAGPRPEVASPLGGPARSARARRRRRRAG